MGASEPPTAVGTESQPEGAEGPAGAAGAAGPATRLPACLPVSLPTSPPARLPALQTIFKRLCRRFGVHKWPYRQLLKQQRVRLAAGAGLQAGLA